MQNRHAEQITLGVVGRTSPCDDPHSHYKTRRQPMSHARGLCVARCHYGAALATFRGNPFKISALPEGIHGISGETASFSPLLYCRPHVPGKRILQTSFGADQVRTALSIP